MPFPSFSHLPHEIRGLIVSKCDISTLSQYFKTAKWTREELRDNEWFWEIKTREDFSGLWEIEIQPEGWKSTYVYYRNKGGNEFLNCLYNDNIKRVQKLLGVGISPNFRFTFENGFSRHHSRRDTVLIGASLYGNLKIVEELLKSGANPNLQNLDGLTALITASDQGYRDIIQLLLKGGANLNLQNGKGETALMMASMRGYPITSIQLLEGGADPNIRDFDGKTALIWASEKGHTCIVRELLKGGADPNIRNEIGRTALEMMELRNHSQLAKRRKFTEIVDILKCWV